MGTGNNKSTKSAPGARKLLYYWLIIGLLGLILGCLGAYIIQLDYFVRWSVFAPAPPDAVQVVAGDPFGVKISTTTGTVVSRNYNDEIWAPGILDHETSRESCDLHRVAYTFLAHPPENTLDCAAFQGSGGQYGYTVLFALDRQGNVWQWRSMRDGMDILLYPLFALEGGGIGILIGSILWTIHRLRANGRRGGQADISGEALPGYTEPSMKVKAGISIPEAISTISSEGVASPGETSASIGAIGTVQGEIPAQPGKSKPAIWLWLLAALPFLCLFVWTLGDCFLGVLIRHSENNPKVTETNDAFNYYQTAEAAWFLAPPATPNPKGPAYDFAAQCPSARWFEFQSEWDCSGSNRSGVVSIETIPYMETSQGTEVQAVQISLPIKQWRVMGKYPLWEIHQGDHFFTTLVCPQESEECNLEYSLYFEEFHEKTIHLGSWALSPNQRAVEVDIDLSHFSGKRVAFVLWVVNEVSDQAEQTALWVNPRIENLP